MALSLFKVIFCISFFLYLSLVIYIIPTYINLRIENSALICINGFGHRGE